MAKGRVQFKKNQADFTYKTGGGDHPITNYFVIFEPGSGQLLTIL